MPQLSVFLVCQSETRKVQMMYQMKKLPYNYIPEHGLQILELPYVDDELSMFILLPEESTDGSDPLLKVHNQKQQFYYGSSFWTQSQLTQGERQDTPWTSCQSVVGLR